jgi:hypothetical protein
MRGGWGGINILPNNSIHNKKNMLGGWQPIVSI